jgi:outer membrane protein OmpA-like peptidoglycan-associated protein
MSQQQSEKSQQQARDAEQRTGQLEAELKELNAKKTERGLVITLGDVLFDTNQAQLKPGGTRSLQKLAGFLKQYPQRHAQVEGHTDNTGAAEYNQALSDRRANAVRAALVDLGVGNDRIATHGYGQASPVASNDTASGRRQNRRVEIIISDDKSDISAR